MSVPVRVWTLALVEFGIFAVSHEGQTLPDAPNVENVRVVEAAPVVELLERLAQTTCREWIADEGPRRCNAPAEFVLWGQLIPQSGLGPRCYDHAVKHVGARALAPGSDFALMDLRPVLALLATLRSQETPDGD